MEKIVKIILWAEWFADGVSYAETDEQVYEYLYNGMKDPDLNGKIPDKIEFIGEKGSKITFINLLKSPDTKPQMSVMLYANWLEQTVTGQPDGQYQTNNPDDLEQIFFDGFSNPDGFPWPAKRIELTCGQITLYHES